MIRIGILLSLCTLLCCGSLSAQQCRTPEISILSAEEDAFNQYVLRFVQDGGAADTSLQVIPTVVHIIMRNAADSMSLARVQSQIYATNLDLRKRNADTARVRAAFKAVAADCQMQLCLATRKPDGNSFAGVLWHSYPNFDPADMSTIRATTQLDPDRYLNVWVQPGQEGGSAVFPWERTATYDGFTLGSLVFGTLGTDLQPGFNEGGIFTHELGHYLGLYHTFHGGFAYLGECSRLHDADIGDLCADTPLDWDMPLSTDQCDDGTRFCSTGDSSVITQSENFMYYNRDSCVQMFSLDQRARMRACTDSARALLVSAANLNVTGAACLPLVSLPETTAAESWTIYPNPAGDIVYIRYAAKMYVLSVHLLDLQGREIRQWQGTVSEAGLQDIPAGIYILRIQGKDFTDSRKLIRR